MSFQPWKQVLPNQFYRNKGDGSEMSSTFGKMKNGDVEISPAGQSTSNLTILPHPFELPSGEYPSPSQYESEQHPKQHSPQQPHHNGTKFSIFSQLLNLNKINAFDNLLLNASLTLDDDDLNGDKRQGMRKLMEQAISDDAKQQIAFILEKISALRPAEKLLLYLKMPGGHSEVDPLKQSQNPLGSRSEISHTINWVRSHLEQDDKVSIPKQEVYEDYVTFCGKISIKPLSTADFGKVMKQVFPDIRPRRLGTRGHSRYCYAAMRKATKLNPPQLPDLSVSLSSTARHSNGDKEDASWKVIKNWSENLLGSRFESVDDLASHISHMSSPSTSSAATSKQMLQKKLMQREMKERKKVNNQPAVKRRRKKRRASTTSSPDHSQDFFNPSILIKQEKETDGSAVENTEQSENSSDVPINLSSVRNSEQPLSTISSSHQHDAEMIKSILKSKLTSVIAPQVSPLAAPAAIEQKQEEHQFIYCKKVRQAQQMKANATLNATVVSTQYQTAPTISVSEPSPSDQPPARILKSPLKQKLKKNSVQAKKMKITDDDLAAPMSQAEANELALKKDDLQPLKEDFILPRERFISICNMDRNALDTYLNSNEENSQDLELLQYFDDEKNKPAEDTLEEDLGAATTSVPLLENYQLNFNEGNPAKCDKQEKINHLRTILEEKHVPSSMGSDSVIKNLLLKEPPQLMPMDSPEVQNYQMQHLSQNYPSMGDKVVPQSPNTLRKNFSFVPIPSSQPSRAVRNVNLMPAFNQSRPADPFASPRVTANSNRRPVQQPLNIRSPNSMSLEGTKAINNIPMLGVNDNTAFCRPSQFKMEPLSAPPSPSMAQHFNFSPQAQQQHQPQQNHFQFNTITNNQPQGTNSYNYPVESRSQSVPPHHTNNMYNNNNYNYSQSACNSVNHTPVPSDYQEFTSDTNLLDIFNNEQPPLPSVVKMETNDDVINDLLENELLSQNSNTSDSNCDMRQNSFNSRSVPTSPYQHANCYTNGMSSSFYPLGKSVPNTPITSNNNNPFRYSPELQRTRDFLINGFNNQQSNNINHNNNNVMSCNKMIKHHDTSQTIHHHANNIVTDVLDSSLLGNL